MYSVICLDPGNSTGWLYQDKEGNLAGGTLPADHCQVWELLNRFRADIVVYETFQLYPSRAQKLSWNSFYPVEVIGIIKIWTYLNNKKLVGLQPSVKKFVGEAKFENVVIEGKLTEHTRDARRLYDYFKKNKNF